jgi:ApaG protein
MYSSETRSIRVSVNPQYLDSNSEPEKGQYVWGYTIVIENLGQEIVQLLTRFWEITDANGQKQIVRGDGVVGEQPVLGPGDKFEYTSGAPLGTPSGFMAGSYGMATNEGEMFDIVVPTFSLDSPHMHSAVH